MARSSKAQCRKELLEQLRRNGTDSAYYRGMVDDYITLFDMKTALTKDVKERGVTVEVRSTAGTNTKKNDSIGELVKVNGQMLRILSELGIKPGQDYGADDKL